MRDGRTGTWFPKRVVSSKAEILYTFLVVTIQLAERVCLSLVLFLVVLAAAAELSLSP